MSLVGNLEDLGLGDILQIRANQATAADGVTGGAVLFEVVGGPLRTGTSRKGQQQDQPDEEGGQLPRRRSMPRTRRRSSTTARGSFPILQVPMGWKIVVPSSPAARSRS